MPDVPVVTDSCASIPKALIETFFIYLAANYINRAEEVLRDQDFYIRLRLHKR